MDFQEFINQYEDKLHTLFHEENDIDTLSLDRGISNYLFDEIMSCDPLSVFIPETYGGRGGKTHEVLSMLETSSYVSLPLSLMMGINGALFLQPLDNYASEKTKSKIFHRFTRENIMGGLMITEPDFGSDALHMETSYTYNEKLNKYRVTGSKHWAGLTGMADYWLITARERTGRNTLGRDISFFVHDSRNGGIEVEELFKNLGLYMLPYGRNKIDIVVPAEDKLQPKSTGIKMMIDILHRSRLQFPGMGMGFLRRMLDEAHSHCKERQVGGQSLFKYEQVKKRISRLQASFTICSAMCNYTSENIPITQDTSSLDFVANTIKTVITDLMQNASQSLLQLMGAKGYRLDHIAGRSMIDSRPFQIFEGSNDILFQQITQSVFKSMKKYKLRNFYDFLSTFKYTQHAADRLKEHLDFEIQHNMDQDKMVELGRVLSRLISMEFTIRLGEKGFNRKLISNTIESLRGDIKHMLSIFDDTNDVEVVENYEEASNWYRSFTPSFADA